MRTTQDPLSDTHALPPPPVPAECDLSEFSWFKLHHRRLERSTWWRGASDFARSRNVDLWAAAFQEVPAASLPDDNVVLAHLAGFGRDVPAFRAAKAELLAPWRLCADGRWYHPTLCEVALDAWEGLSEKRRKAREKKARQRAQARGDVLPPVPGDSSEIQGDTRVEEKRGEERRTEEKRHIVVSDEPKPGPVKAAPKGWLTDEPFYQAWDACTRQMRQRSKSRDKTWEAWRRVAARVGPEQLLAALRAYLRQDKDIERTGGPGFHKWLADGTWEHWLAAAPDPAAPPPDRLRHWRARVSEFRFNGYWPGDAGPRPGRPGCLCPVELLEEATASGG